MLSVYLSRTRDATWLTRSKYFRDTKKKLSDEEEDPSKFLRVGRMRVDLRGVGRMCPTMYYVVKFIERGALVPVPEEFRDELFPERSHGWW
jgi:hypothetical protein